MIKTVIAVLSPTDDRFHASDSYIQKSLLVVEFLRIVSVSHLTSRPNLENRALFPLKGLNGRATLILVDSLPREWRLSYPTL